MHLSAVAPTPELHHSIHKYSKMCSMQLYYLEPASDESWGKWRVFEQGSPIPASYS